MNLIKNIFLVDDDATFVFMTKKIIRSTAIDSNINEFADGEAAIDFLKDHLDHNEPLPDVIFLDLNMPIMDGWGFLEEYTSLVARIKKKVKLYIVSSSISPHDIEHAKHFSTVSDFIIKPLLKEKFIEIIESL